MTDLQAYLVILSGFVISSAMILINQPKASGWLIQFLKTALILQIGFYFVRILSLPFHRVPLLAQILYAGFIVAFSFYAGAFVSYWINGLLFKKRLQAFKATVFQNIGPLYRLLKIAASTLFFYSSIASLFYYSKALQFFAISGYGEVFFIFILLVEFTCAIGLLFWKTVLYAALLLMCDMLGAMYTHYHNYFAKHLADPLGNSIPSLITQTVLVSIIICTMYYKRVKYD